MRRQSILAPRRFAVGLLSILLVGCSPRLDWREIQDDAAGWRATFPGKPVEVSRQLSLPDGLGSIRLTLRSTRVDDAMFAVGWADADSPAVREALESAMLANIAADVASTQRKTVVTFGQQMMEVIAAGRMRLTPDGPPIPARLMMRSTITAHGAVPDTSENDKRPNRWRVIEIIAVGPTAQITDDDARQFVESLRISAKTVPVR